MDYLKYLPTLNACLALPGLPKISKEAMISIGEHVLQQQKELAITGPGKSSRQMATEIQREKDKEDRLLPEVVEFAVTHGLTGRQSELLDEQLKKRKETLEDDILALHEILTGARNPWNLLKECIRWMDQGTFAGTRAPNPEVEKIVKKFGLDAPSVFKLCHVLEDREDPNYDLAKICSHLERSNRPSSVAMTLAKDLKDGKPIDMSTKAAAPGSYLHTEKGEKPRDDRGRGGDKDRGGDRDRRERSRSRRGRDDRERGRGKSRGRSKDRNDGDRRGRD